MRRPTTHPFRWASAALTLGVSLSLLCGPALLAERKPAETHSAAGLGPSDPPILGQWIWTSTDAARFGQARQLQPTLKPTLLIGSIRGESGALELKRGLNPELVKTSEVAVLVRLEDSVHGVWSELSPTRFAARLEAMLTQLLLEVTQSGVQPTELQLDYDAPLSKLPQWASVLGELHKGPLSYIPLWITSIPSHLSDPAYGARLSGSVDGHILQLFDTGLDCSAAEARRVSARLSDQGLRYRVGVGAFERRGAAGSPSGTQHGCWVEQSAQFRRESLFQGYWVFGANQRVDWVLSQLGAQS